MPSSRTNTASAMRTLNFFIFSLIAFMAVTSLIACRDKDKSNDEEQPQVIRSNDELKPSSQDVLTAPQQLKSTLNTLTSEVNDGFDEITSLEQAIDETSVSQLSQSKRAKLRNNILLMKNTIQDRLRALAELDDDLGELDDKSRTEIAQAINNLRQQLALQQTRINQLNAKLQHPIPKAEPHNEPHDTTTVNSQPTEPTQTALSNGDQQKEQREMLNKELNECYYAIGTREELKGHKIIDSEFLKKTKVMQSGNLLISYFTRADKRTLSEITIPSKKFTILTNHDLQSFSTEENGDKTIIKILNPATFWELSNYLVVLTE